MGSVPSSGHADVPLAAFKVLIAGGFGAGKTTMVGAISEVRPLHTEETLTRASVGRDDLTGVGNKKTTTVAMDFGRLTLAEDLILYLFGTPGQRRFWFMWDDLCLGAIGAVVLVDTARLDASFSPLDYFESKGLPFIVAVNQFNGVQHYSLDAISDALALRPEVPIMSVDARDRESAKKALIRVTEYALERLTESFSTTAS
jgi:uncharacterized protein